MGRAEKAQRRRRRQDRKRRRGGAGGDWGNGFVVAGPDGREFRAVTYSITYDRLEHQDEPANRAFNRVTSEDHRREICAQARDEPLAAIPQLEELLRRHPGTPILYNWLCAAYVRAGLDAKANEMIRLNFEQNPNYLFARAAFVDLCLREGRIDRAAEVLDHKFDLTLLYPHRKVFHVSEFIAFTSMVIQYHLRIGQTAVAETMFKALEQVAPDSEQTKVLRARIRSPVAGLHRVRDGHAAKARQEAGRQST